MFRRSCAVSLALGLIGCGSEPLEPAELGEVCGVQGPFRLISLAPDKGMWEQPILFEDRYVYTTFRIEGTGADARSVEPEAWSIGTCGESPRRLADDVDRVRVDPRWPDVLFGCRDVTNDIVTLDPAGLSAPHVVFADVGCFTRETPWGMFRVVGEDPDSEDSPAALSLLPYPDDPRTGTAEPIVLLDPVSHPEYPISENSLLRRLPDDIFILAQDGTLLRVALPGGEVSVELTGVHSFTISGDGRYLLYQWLASTGGQQGSSTVFLRDRTTGDGLSLAGAESIYPFYAFTRYDENLIMLPVGGDVWRIYFVPALDFVDLPPRVELLAPIGDGRWLMQERYTGGPIYLGDLRDLDSTVTLFGGGTLVEVRPDGILALDAPPCCFLEGAREAEGALWFVPFDGGAARLLAERASYQLRLVDDHRAVTTVQLGDPDESTAILLVDLDTRTEALIEQRIPLAHPGYLLGPIVDGVLRYSVFDGERAGLWLARLPAAP